MISASGPGGMSSFLQNIRFSLSMSKETYYCQKRPISVKRDLLVSKETYQWQFLAEYKVLSRARTLSLSLFSLSLLSLSRSLSLSLALSCSLGLSFFLFLSFSVYTHTQMHRLTARWRTRSHLVTLTRITMTQA